MAREFQKVSDYTQCRRFEDVIDKAKTACQNSNVDINERYREDILANLFRISQTEQKLKNENIKLEKKANETHYEVGKEIRNTIKKLGGTMSENLPTSEKNLKELEKDKDFIFKYTN